MTSQAHSNTRALKITGVIVLCGVLLVRCTTSMIGQQDRYAGVILVFVHETDNGLATTLEFDGENKPDGTVIIRAMDYKAGGFWVPTTRVTGWRITLDYNLQNADWEFASFDTPEEYQQYLSLHPKAAAFTDAAFAEIERAGLSQFSKANVFGFVKKSPLWYGYLENILITIATVWLIVLAGRSVFRSLFVPAKTNSL